MDSRKAALCCIAMWFGSGPLSAEISTQPESADPEQVAVTFFTEPANASLYSPSGGLYGATPLTLYYQVPATWDGCVELEALQAVWVSGVQAEVQLTACPENSHQQHFTFVRPEHDGADLDIWFAQKVEQLAMVEEPVSLARNPENAARVESLGGNLISCNDHGDNANGCR